MKNYLARVQKNQDNYYHTVVCAGDLKEACRLANKLAEGLRITGEYYISSEVSYRLVEHLTEGSISADEYYSLVGYNYQYANEYANCYANGYANEYANCYAYIVSEL